MVKLMPAKSAGWGTAISSCLSLPVLAGVRAASWTPTAGQASLPPLPAAWSPQPCFRRFLWVPRAATSPGPGSLQLGGAFPDTLPAGPRVGSRHCLRPPLGASLGPAEGTQDPFAPYPIFVERLGHIRATQIAVRALGDR